MLNTLATSQIHWESQTDTSEKVPPTSSFAVFVIDLSGRDSFVFNFFDTSMSASEIKSKTVVADLKIAYIHK